MILPTELPKHVIAHLSLQLEARSVTHLQGLNKGLERKVIELQMKLVDKEMELQTAQEQWNMQKCSYEEVYTCTHEIIWSDLKHFKGNATQHTLSRQMLYQLS